MYANDWLARAHKFVTFTAEDEGAAALRCFRGREPALSTRNQGPPPLTPLFAPVIFSRHVAPRTQTGVGAANLLEIILTSGRAPSLIMGGLHPEYEVQAIARKSRCLPVGRWPTQTFFASVGTPTNYAEAISWMKSCWGTYRQPKPGPDGSCRRFPWPTQATSGLEWATRPITLTRQFVSRGDLCAKSHKDSRLAHGNRPRPLMCRQTPRLRTQCRALPSLAWLLGRLPPEIR